MAAHKRCKPKTYEWVVLCDRNPIVSNGWEYPIQPTATRLVKTIRVICDGLGNVRPLIQHSRRSKWSSINLSAGMKGHTKIHETLIDFTHTLGV